MKDMDNITKAELELLENCQDATQWSDACDEIKRGHGGLFPDDWWDRVRMSGMMDRILACWDGSGDIVVRDLTTGARIR